MELHSMFVSESGSLALINNLPLPASWAPASRFGQRPTTLHTYQEKRRVPVGVWLQLAKATSLKRCRRLS